MASTQTTRPARVFVDSSVLIAAAISPTGSARDLLIAGLTGDFLLFFSEDVIEETERNLARKAPAALSVFSLLREAFAEQTVIVDKTLVQRVAQVVELKDAPIVAGAIHAEATYLATYDRKHLLAHRVGIEQHFSIYIRTPDDILTAA